MKQVGDCISSLVIESGHLLQKITFSIQLEDPGQLQHGYEMNLI